jgi:hypothetical protein
LHFRRRKGEPRIFCLYRAAIPLVGFGDERTVKNVTFNYGLIFTLKLIFNMKVPE